MMITAGDDTVQILNFNEQILRRELCLQL